MAPRTLQKQFHRFVGRAPLAYLRELRFARARQTLLCGGEASVTAVAAACGFTHLGRFATDYHRRYGETPRDTLRNACATMPSPVMPVLSARLERPTLALLPFAAPSCAQAAALADDLALALW